MREFVITHVILAPGASKGGVGSCGACATLPSKVLVKFLDPAWVDFVHRHCKRSESDVQFHQDPRASSWPCLASSWSSSWTMGCQRVAKVTPRRAPWQPKAPQKDTSIQGEPKGGQSHPKGSKNKLQKHSKESNISRNYIHII